MIRRRGALRRLRVVLAQGRRRSCGGSSRRSRHAARSCGSTSTTSRRRSTGFDRIAAGIDGSDNFLCIISPDWVPPRSAGASSTTRRSAASASCRCLLAASTPRSCRPPPRRSTGSRSTARDALDGAIATLVEQMETDLEHVQGHTRWGQEAQDWERHERDPDYLLRGSELTSAEGWLTARGRQGSRADGAAERAPRRQPPGGRAPPAPALRGGERRARRVGAADDLRARAALVGHRPAQHGARARARRAGGAQLRARSGARGPARRRGRRAKPSAESEDTLRTALVRSRVRARHDLGAHIDSVEHLARQRALRRLDARRARVRLRPRHEQAARHVRHAHARRGRRLGPDEPPGRGRRQRRHRAGLRGADAGERSRALQTGHDVVTRHRVEPGRTAPRGRRGRGRGVGGRDPRDRRRRAGLGRRVRAQGRDAHRTPARRVGARLDRRRQDAAHRVATTRSVRVWRTDGWKLRLQLRHAADDVVTRIHDAAVRRGRRRHRDGARRARDARERARRAGRAHRHAGLGPAARAS